MSIKQLRFPMSDVVIYYRSVEEGRKGGPPGTGFMKKVGLQQLLEDR